MARNPFRQLRPANNPNRNPFDLTFQNNLTMKIGKLYPVMCKEVIPGDSFKIEPYFGLRFQPMFFPVQNRIRADLHFFYVRNRNLWKNWNDFIFNDKDGLVAPYIDRKGKESEFFVNGSLSDYLGVPTSVVTSVKSGYSSTLMKYPYFKEHFPESVLALGSSAGLNLDCFSVFIPVLPKMTLGQPLPISYYSKDPYYIVGSGENLRQPLSAGEFSLNLPGIPKSMFEEQLTNFSIVLCSYDDAWIPVASSSVLNSPVYEDGKISFTITDDLAFLTTQGPCKLSELFGKYDCTKLRVFLRFRTPADSAILVMGIYSTIVLYSGENKTPGFPSLDYQIAGYNTEYTVTNGMYDVGRLPLSALPYRAYESIFNAFYRNTNIDPLLIDGKPEYNKFLVNDGDGSDNFEYKLHTRYWEKDFLTSCMPSPQSGAAPLVGVTQFTPGKTQLMKLEDGSEIKIVTDDNDSVVGISGYSVDTPIGTVERLQELIQSGISINDFRAVNSLQRWLEVNFSHGFRYKEQLKQHFGVDVSFEVLDMPEFLGGLSRTVNVSTIYNQTSGNGNALGDYGGIATCIGEPDGTSVSKYFDEHGFVIALLSVVPVPAYSQVLPKHFTKHHHLDYFSPEFAHLGLQPVRYNEVTPLQAMSSGSSVTVDDVFGYNRSWYDYLQSYDEVHGDFRNTLRNFLINREFATCPSLDPQFISIDSEEVNDVFNDTKDTDKILGQVMFKISAKRPLPMFGIPRLE